MHNMVFIKDNLYMKSIYFMLILTFFGVQLLSGQQKFHRTYPVENGDENIYLLDAIQLNNGEYATLSWNTYPNINGSMPAIFNNAVITTYKPKGDINWSIEIVDSLNYLFGARGSLVQGKNDSLYFKILGPGHTTSGSINFDGKPGKLYTSPTINEQRLSANNTLVEFNGTIINGTTRIENNTSSIVLRRQEYGFSDIWSKKFDFNDTSLKNKISKVTSVKIGLKSNVVLTGIVDSTHSFVAVADTFGNMLWSKKYADPDTKKSIPTFLDAVMLNDSTLLMAGYVTEFPGTTGSQEVKGLLIKTDKRGNITWSKKVQFQQKDTTRLDNIILEENGDLLISGRNFDIAKNASYPIVVKFNSNGNIIWKKKYPRVNATKNYSSIFSTKDGGSSIFHTTIEKEKAITSFVKVDASGSSSCEETITEEIFFEDGYVSDTLRWTVINFSQKDSLVKIIPKKHNYAVPVLSLAVRPFCPKEPIDWTFKATTKGATNYEWSTGANGPTMDTIRVTQTGEYSVTVTIGEGVCYMLCDTAMLDRYTLPGVSMSLSLGNFCSNGKQTLIANHIPGHPNTKSYTWSTGDKDVDRIEIANPGVYKVTIVDQCDETATGEITVGPFPTKITSATITGNPSVSCTSGTITGLLSAQGNSTGLGPETYRWNNGAATKEISINESNLISFTVTVTDLCGTSATATKEIALVGEGIKSVTISKTASGVCEEKKISLNAVTNVLGNYLYVWSNGAQVPNLVTKEPGTYSVTVTDRCGNTASASVQVTKEELEPDDIIYANIFFPDGMSQRLDLAKSNVDSMLIQNAITYNRTFGPINQEKYCLDNITKYEFYVFNRWGQKVFESTEISKEWDGEHNSEKAPSETYVWIVKYTILGAEKIQKGSVTLIRL
jgi:gliding motility-associated-like protein